MFVKAVPLLRRLSYTRAGPALSRRFRWCFCSAASEEEQEIGDRDLLELYGRKLSSVGVASMSCLSEEDFTEGSSIIANVMVKYS